MIAQTTIPAGWETFGILGLVISALLSGLGYLYRDKVRREREMDVRHAQERAEWRTECKAERSEIMAVHQSAWEENRRDVKESHDRLSGVVGELTTAVRDLHVDVKARRLEEQRREKGGNG